MCWMLSWGGYLTSTPAAGHTRFRVEGFSSSSSRLPLLLQGVLGWSSGNPEPCRAYYAVLSLVAVCTLE
jgi:hypothetical protein